MSDFVPGDEQNSRSVFVSYRRLDDIPPPEKPNAKGFVKYFWEQLSYELTALGLPEGILWLDRNRIEQADEFTRVIAEQLAKSDILLAILSRNYVRSGWCAAEVDAFATRLGALEDHVRRRRIFRVDKQEVSDAELPEPLRGIQSTRFYEKDPESGVEQEFYHRSKVLRRTPYLAAIREIAVGIFRRLNELGLPQVAPAPAPVLQLAPSNGRTIYVSRPAPDLLDPYSTLVRELRARGFTVVPDPQQELPSDGAEALRTVRSSLAAAEFSVHLVGERHGFQPDGIDTGIVSVQLAEARAHAAQKSGFHRLIWAPKIVPGTTRDTGERDPLAVVDTFDRRTPTDEIDGDTSARFNEYVLQRVRTERPRAPAKQPRVFVGCLAADQQHGLELARQVREAGGSPIFSLLDPRTMAGSSGQAALMARAPRPALLGRGRRDRHHRRARRARRPGLVREKGPRRC